MNDVPNREDWLSPSQYKTWKLCKRKWAWDKLDGLPRDATAATNLGTATHAQLESYLKTGFIDLTTKQGEIALSGIHLLPAPLTTGMEIEKHFGIKIGETYWQGFKDVRLPGYVIDHKTCSSFGWALTPVELQTDVQAVIYAVHDMAETGLDYCNVRWVYYRTKGRREARPVDAVIRKAEIGPTLKELDDTGQLIQLTRKTYKTALELPPTVSACDAFGGCPYESHCNLSPQERMTSIMSATEDFRSQLQAKLAAQPGVPNTAMPTQEPQPPPQPQPIQQAQWTPPQPQQPQQPVQTQQQAPWVPPQPQQQQQPQQPQPEQVQTQQSPNGGAPQQWQNPTLQQQIPVGPPEKKKRTAGRKPGPIQSIGDTEKHDLAFTDGLTPPSTDRVWELVVIDSSKGFLWRSWK